MKWTMEHDKICCQIYLDKFIKSATYSDNIKNECILLAKAKG